MLSRYFGKIDVQLDWSLFHDRLNLSSAKSQDQQLRLATMIVSPVDIRPCIIEDVGKAVATERS